VLVIELVNSVNIKQQIILLYAATSSLQAAYTHTRTYIHVHTVDDKCQTLKCLHLLFRKAKKDAKLNVANIDTTRYQYGNDNLRFAHH